MLDINDMKLKDDSIGQVTSQKNISREMEDHRFCFVDRKFRFFHIMTKIL